MTKMLKKSIHLVIALICSIALFLAGAFIVPKPISAVADVPSGFKNISFSNFGIASGDYTYSNSQGYAASGQLGESIDMKYFSGYMKLTGAPCVYIAGNANGKGLKISTLNGGVALSVYWGNTRITNLAPNKADITFKDTEFHFGITFKKVNADTDNTVDDLELAFWFDGKPYDNGNKFYAYNVNSELGDFVSIECPMSGAAAKITNDSNAGAIPDKSLNQLSTQHFYIADATYGYADGAVAASGTYPLGTKNSHFSANVTFSAVEGAGIYYAGLEKDGGLGGLTFRLQDGNLVLTENITGNNFSVTFNAADAGLTAFADIKFKLGVSIKTVNKDDGNKNNDLEIGIWFNDILYKNEFIYLLDSVNNIGGTMGIYSPTPNSTVTVGVISGMEINMPNPELQKTTFDTFNIIDGEYSSNGDIAKFGDSKNSIANTYFSGKVKFNGSAQVIYGNANGAKWTGMLRIYPVNATTFAITNYNATAQIATIPVSGTPLKSAFDEFRLGISTEVIDNDDDGEKDDVKIGFYFNEDLCDGGFIYQNDYAQYVGTGMSFYTPTGTSVKVGTVREFLPPPEALPEGLREISIDSFSIENGVYKYRNNDLAFNKGYAKKSLQDTNLIFNVKFTKDKNDKELSFRYAGGGWGGIQIAVSSDKITLRHTSNAAISIDLTAENSGLESFIGTKYKMGFTTQYMDLDNDGEKDDVRFGVWVDGVLCGNKYFELIDYTGKLGKNLALYVAGTTDTVELESIEVPPYVIPDDQRHKMPEDLTKITLNDFTINDCVATYKRNDLYLNSKYDKSLDNTYCEFYVTPSSTAKEMSIRYGGGGWSGLSIQFKGQNLMVHPTADTSKIFTLSASDSKMTSFADQTYLLGISTQYMDLDNDGEKDDVRFGLWANGTLCGNEYIDLVDYVQYMGKNLSVYIAEEGATLGLKSIMIPIDFELFGFTAKWATELNLYASGITIGGSNTSSSSTMSPQTGDTLVRPMLFSCVALGGLINTETNHRRKLYK